MRSDSVTCHTHTWTRTATTPAIQAGSRFTYPGGMEGWVDLGAWWFTCLQTVTHLTGRPNHLPASRPAVEPTISRSYIQRFTLPPFNTLLAVVPHPPQSDLRHRALCQLDMLCFYYTLCPKRTFPTFSTVTWKSIVIFW